MEQHQTRLARSDDKIIAAVKALATSRTHHAFVKDANEMLRKHNNKKILDKDYLTGF